MFLFLHLYYKLCLRMYIDNKGLYTCIYYDFIRRNLTKLYVAGMIYNILCQKFPISILTIDDFSIVITRDHVYLVAVYSLCTILSMINKQ